MKINKNYKKFYEVGQNKYYLFKFDDELHIATESVLPLKTILGIKREISQGFKLLQLTGPISMLFQEIINSDVENEDTDFPDMTTYKIFDNKAFRIKIEKTYKGVVEDQINKAKNDFEDWVDNFTLNDGKNIKEETLNDIIETQRLRLEENIKSIEQYNILNSLSFKWVTGENLVIKKLLENNMEFLYSQKIGSNYKIYYLYDLDMYGTVTIYKIHTVKNVIKSIDSFIYNRKIIQEMMVYMANHNL